MVGDLWLRRTHGGPGFRGWLRRQVGDAITFLKHGRHLAYNHTMLELEGGLLMDPGRRVDLVDAESVLLDPFSSVLVVRYPWQPLERVTINAAGMKLVGARYSYFTALGHAFGRRVAAWIAKRDGATVICSEATAQVLAIATGFRFFQRHTTDELEPAAARPRDLAWTVVTDAGVVRHPWSLVVKTSHGKAVKYGVA